MGLNSPIELKMTAAGLAAKDNADSIIFTRFLAGADGTNASTEVVNVKQVIPINNYIKRTAGETYIENGVETVATESSLKITGYGNSTDAEENYMLNEIALMAKLSDDGEEFCFAYDYTNTDTMRIRITRSQGIQCVYEMIFSRTPNLTITTSETGVTYSDLYAHTDRSIGPSPVHGMVWDNNQLTINGQVFDGVSNERIKKITGIDYYYSMLPNPSMSLYNKVALVTTSNELYRCLKTINIDSGIFIRNDQNDGWVKANGSEVDKILVIDDGLTPSSNEICVTDAQNHFMEWVQIENFNSRLNSLEANSNFLQYDPLDNREYNSEWVDRMTGSGTPASPFCIYTPKDFSMIGRTEQYGLDKVYKLMNNLDFSSIIGMSVAINDDSYEITTINQEAPLYNNGEGLWPVGYDGYYPSCGERFYNPEAPYYEGPQTWQQVLARSSSNTESSYGAFGLGASPSAPSFSTSINYADSFIRYCFTGEFDGNDKILKGIICAPVNTYSVGLFMFLSNGASIHNFMIKDSIFILSDVYHAFGDSSGVKLNAMGSVAGLLCRHNTNNHSTVNIFNVYNYATLLNNTMSYSDRYTSGSYTGGILGWQAEQDNIYIIISNCANHGNMIYTNETIKHNMSGIVNSTYRYNNHQEVMNCINTSSFTGYSVKGIGYVYTSKTNINTGILKSYENSVNPDYPLLMVISGTGERDEGSMGFYNNQMYGEKSNNFYGNVVFLPKSPEYLKSEEFITEANSYLSIPVWTYNDLGVNDGWPLLTDEYNMLMGINGSLSLAIVDGENKKVYKSGLPMKKFQTIPTYKEMNAAVETKLSLFETNNLSNLKIITLTISPSDWMAVEDNGVATGKYKATKTVTGITATSPVQLLTQLSTLEIKITEISSNSISLSSDTQPDSDLKVSVMFTA